MLSLFKRLKAARKARKLASSTPEEVFGRIYAKNTWGDAESASGKGSNLAATSALREELSSLLTNYKVTSLLDVPCGDFNWMSQVPMEGIAYCGGDIVPDLIARNQTQYGSNNRTFKVIDLTSSQLPECDMIFTRDCLVHLAFSDAAKAIENIRNSSAQWLVATTFPETTENTDILTGQWRRLDMTKPPFNFPAPNEIIHESFAGDAGGNTDKSMGVWRITDLPATRLVS